MTKSASLLVRQQVPEFVVNDSPRFIEFMKAYYEYLDEFDVDLSSLRNVDDTADSLVQFLRSEFANKFPNSQVNDRKLIKIIRELYKVKGTVNAIDLLFRIFFSEAVTVWEPGKQLLRPSDGKWEQLQSITATTKFGVLPTDVANLTLQFSSNNSVYNVVEASKVELIAPNTYTIYFRYTILSREADQEVDFYNGPRLVWKGQVVRSPARFDVIDGGEKWKVGQVIRFPGTQSDTILQVENVTSTGVIESVRAIEWGRFHTEDQSVLVSPYANKPTNATYDIQSTIVGYDSATDTYIYDHVIELNDYIDNINEDVVGHSNSFNERSYVGFDYVDDRYVGQVVIAVKSGVAESASSLNRNSSITIEEWLASRATIVCKFGDITTYTGKYLTEDGQVSNPSIRIQDSYFYQLFSYVIQTTRSINEYEGIITAVHPAGYKYFNDLLRTDLVLANEFTVLRTITNDKVFMNDLVDDIDEEMILGIIKYFGHEVVAVDGGVVLALSKLVANSVTAADLISTLSAAKELALSLVVDDAPIKRIDRQLATSIGGIDVISHRVTKTTNDETINSDSQTRGINKSIIAGTTSVDDNGSSNSLTRFDYTTEDFFSEDYMSPDIILQIG